VTVVPEKKQVRLRKKVVLRGRSAALRLFPSRHSCLASSVGSFSGLTLTPGTKSPHQTSRPSPCLTRGREVGLLARPLYPVGIEVAPGVFDLDRVAVETKRLLALRRPLKMNRASWPIAASRALTSGHRMALTVGIQVLHVATSPNSLPLVMERL
jgi:hypothetical protein